MAKPEQVTDTVTAKSNEKQQTPQERQRLGLPPLPSEFPSAETLRKIWAEGPSIVEEMREHRARYNPGRPLRPGRRLVR